MLNLTQVWSGHLVLLWSPCAGEFGGRTDGLSAWLVCFGLRGASIEECVGHPLGESDWESRGLDRNCERGGRPWEASVQSSDRSTEGSPGEARSTRAQEEGTEGNPWQRVCHLFLEVLALFIKVHQGVSCLGELEVLHCVSCVRVLTPTPRVLV